MAVSKPIVRVLRHPNGYFQVQYRTKLFFFSLWHNHQLYETYDEAFKEAKRIRKQRTMETVVVAELYEEVQHGPND